ncbi:hypothetical protein [Actinomadura chokoriensis]|uniref:hypothetical protein n=1 Tax=Actinomadura chokoriensis TaxID=454156 RepID=UPI0031F77FF5
MVALTRLLASSYWRGLTIGTSSENSTFVNEVRRAVAPGYVWNPRYYHRYLDPLVKLLLNDQERQDAADRHRFTPPEPPGDTLEFTEMRHHN